MTKLTVAYGSVSVVIVVDTKGTNPGNKSRILSIPSRGTAGSCHAQGLQRVSMPDPYLLEWAGGCTLAPVSTKATESG